MLVQENGWDIGAILSRYAEPLLRRVADKLLKPRSTWPIDDLRQRCIEGLQNPILIDRRLKEIAPECRKLLRMVHWSHQPVWRIDHLMQLLACLGHIDGVQPVLALLEAGLVFPELLQGTHKIRTFEDWLGIGGLLHSRVYLPVDVTVRAIETPLELPQLEGATAVHSGGIVGDGWEWPIRIAAAWQKLDGSTVKVSQSGTYYKRELSKLQNDPVLNAPFAMPLVELPEPGVLAFAWARSIGMFHLDKTEIVPNGFGEIWQHDLATHLCDCLAALFPLVDWNPIEGYSPETSAAPLPSMALMMLLLLAEQSVDSAVPLDSIREFIEKKHPHGSDPRSAQAWVRGLVLGVFAQLRIVEVFNRPEGEFVRLSDLGHWILRGGKKPELEASHIQTLTVQPNGEIILFRQHLRIALIADLTRFANWKSIGAACTLEIDADRLYRGLESGLSFPKIVQTLDKYGMYPLPGNVRDSIHRWANKRERVVVYAAATLIEFIKPEELEEAYRRGLIAQKLTDRIGLSESADLDYKHFRLLGNRDYESSSQPCVEFGSDGLTFDVVAARADLLLEAELKQLADPLPLSGSFERRRYRFTLERLRRLAESGWTLEYLDRWCRERGGVDASPAARLLFQPHGNLRLAAEEKLVVILPDSVVTDGICQWPDTAQWIEERLGPVAISVKRDRLPNLKQELAKIGIEV